MADTQLWAKMENVSGSIVIFFGFFGKQMRSPLGGHYSKRPLPLSEMKSSRSVNADQ